jgi:hypothetical protein
MRHFHVEIFVVRASVLLGYSCSMLINLLQHLEHSSLIKRQFTSSTHRKMTREDNIFPVMDMIYHLVTDISSLNIFG